MISEDELRTMRERMRKAERREDAAVLFGQIVVGVLLAVLIYFVFVIIRGEV